jgi:hypothetical protein
MDLIFRVRHSSSSRTLRITSLLEETEGIFFDDEMVAWYCCFIRPSHSSAKPNRIGYPERRKRTKSHLFFPRDKSCQ